MVNKAGCSFALTCGYQASMKMEPKRLLHGKGSVFFWIIVGCGQLVSGKCHERVLDKTHTECAA